MIGADVAFIAEKHLRFVPGNLRAQLRIAGQQILERFRRRASRQHNLKDVSLTHRCRSGFANSFAARLAITAASARIRISRSNCVSLRSQFRFFLE